MIAGMIASVKPKAPSKALLNAADLEIPFAMNVMAATQDFLKKNPEQVERALKGLYRRRRRQPHLDTIVR
jgi:hypothetical protein